VARFVPECTTNGLSVVAVPLGEPETQAGVFICRDFKSPLPDGIPVDFPWFGPIGAILMGVDEAYEATRPGLKRGDAVDLWMVGVRPAADSPRRGSRAHSFVSARTSLATRASGAA
jgi:hypothetical protein